MGTITRFRHVVSANVNALLERAEDPEKMLAALIREMEDALGEAREAAAGILDDQKRFKRRAAELDAKVSEWEERAEHALSRQREDLAREAIAAKQQAEAERAQVEAGLGQADQSVERVHQDIGHLETRLQEARKRQAEMKREVQSRQRPAGGGTVTPYTSPADRKLADVMARFERLESQLEHLESRVEAYDIGPGPAPMPDVADDPRVEQELEAIRNRVRGRGQESE